MKCVNDTNLSKLSPFVICKVIDGICGNVQQVKPLKNGQLLIKVNSQSQAEKLLRCKSILDNRYAVSVSPAEQLNSSKGVIYADELRLTSESELLQNFGPSGVTKVQRLNKGPDKTATALLVLTFSASILPYDVKAGYSSYRVRPYYPRPFQCFKCFKYGHGQDQCRVEDRLCRHCGESGHDHTACSSLAKCVNCSLDHGSTDRSCPKYKDEVNIIKLRVDRRITMAEAKRIYTATPNGSEAVGVPTLPVPFSAAVDSDRPQSVSIGQAKLAVDNKARVWSFVREVIRVSDANKSAVKTKASKLAKLINEYGIAVGANIEKFSASDGIPILSKP